MASTMHTLTILLGTLAMLGESPACFTPATELCAACDDLASRVLPQDWPQTRYLSLFAWPSEQWPEGAAVASFVLNSVSRQSILVRPHAVPGSEGRLLRLSLADYGLPAEVWEAVAGEDPYFHLRTQVLDPATKKPITVYTDGGWLDLNRAALLRERTRSSGALLRADYFLARASTTSNGGVYYQLAGVPPREADFYEQLGIDLKTIGRLEADIGANLIRSGVTRKVRRVARRQGPLGGAWITYDVERSTAERDPLRNPFAFEFDASEHIAAKANGLHLFALYNRQGQRQDAVPDRVAKDSADPHGDGIIVPLVSCVRCHVEDGLRPVFNDQQRLLAGRVDLVTENPRDARRLASFYSADLERRRRRDGDDYAQAVRTATGGMSSAEVAAALARLYGGYADALVTPEQAARELGIVPAELPARLAASDDAVILALCEGLAVQRQQWEAAFAQAALLTTKGTP